MGRILRGLAGGGDLRVVAAETTDVVEEARLRHGLSPTATAALGRAMTGALLLAQLLLKTPKERITLRVEGTGPLGGLVVEADAFGHVRGYVKNPRAEVPLREDGKLNVGELVGAGALRVDRSLPSGEVYTSTVPLVSGEIAEDLAHYLWQSEQIPSAVLLGVRVKGEGEVEVAGGVAVQVMPGAREEVLDRLEANLKDLPGLTPLLRERGLEGALEALLAGLGFERTDLRALGYFQNEIPARFRCRCNREKALEALVFFTPEEREEMIVKEGGAEVVCHWCGEVYRFSPEEVRSLVAEVRCPDCGALWLYPKGDGTLARIEGETCRCGRKVELPSETRPQA
ncbi:Hsp33 family molecular chaperone HslO [Thermus thermophilus]|uniref:Hsp33 family molecular chaperone HslO n=1 Tax=Thermus thermophilus TaxID=274 RepID=UPI001FCC6591|nr:Hsp33 family molecular chaperone HslO [Thermus thermophilus]BDG21299.1 33 kDa chaperonin [Thermus thermophilus]BDG28912.1 33 kDa chaperonin [Thermus thermophilus]